MRTIYKYTFNNSVELEVMMPANANILCVQMQFNTPCIWAEVESTNDLEKRIFRIFGTGIAIISDYVLEYVGTFQMLSGQLIYHVYEEKQ